MILTKKAITHDQGTKWKCCILSIANLLLLGSDLYRKKLYTFTTE